MLILVRIIFNLIINISWCTISKTGHERKLWTAFCRGMKHANTRVDTCLLEAAWCRNAWSPTPANKALIENHDGEDEGTLQKSLALVQYMKTLFTTNQPPNRCQNDKKYYSLYCVYDHIIARNKNAYLKLINVSFQMSSTDKSEIRRVPADIPNQLLISGI